MCNREREGRRQQAFKSSTEADIKTTRIPKKECGCVPPRLNIGSGWPRCCRHLESRTRADLQRSLSGDNCTKPPGAKGNC
jgi:hypothetical protein